MKKRIGIGAALAASVVSVFLLAGCATTIGPGAGSNAADAPKTVDLSNAKAVAALCGDDANGVYEFVKSAAKANPNSGQRHALVTTWGLDDATVKSDTKLAQIVSTLKTRAATRCAANGNNGTVGVQDTDGKTKVLPVINSTKDTDVVVDSTGVAATPPLLDGSLRFTAQTLTWAGLVQRVGSQQWYIDGINARAAQTGFTWNDVKKFASVNDASNGQCPAVNALAIQVYNQPNLTDEQVRAQVAKYITPSVEKVICITVDQLPIQRINNGFVNTRNDGTTAFPAMGNYFDNENMIRVSLMPITFDAKGTPVGLDGSKGAGIFIDCGNLHWVPQAVWKCTDSSCTKPQCPAGMTGTPPNCKTPPPTTCPPGYSGTPPNCLENKGPSIDNGWTPLGAGPLTNGHISQEQQDSGQTRGNVTDNKVPEGTKSGDTTPDLPKGTVTAPGATSGGDDTSNDVTDPTTTNHDDGGTSGDTCITNPLTGESNC